MLLAIVVGMLGGSAAGVLAAGMPVRDGVAVLVVAAGTFAVLFAVFGGIA